MAELKAGGMAIIIKSRIEGNVGRTVKLIRHLGVMKGHVMDEFHDSWEVAGVCGNNLKGYLPDGFVVSWPVVFCPAAWLMPIDGDDFSHEKESEKQLQNA